MNFNIKFNFANFITNFCPSNLNNKILLYHSITNSLKQDIFSVDKNKFEKQLKLLKKFYENDLRNIDENLKYNSSITLSFDDGKADNFFTAYPLINKYKIPTIFFISTSKIGKEGYLSNNMIKEMNNNKYIDFGLHGHNHVSFADLDINSIKYEMDTSKKILEDLLEKKIKFFSYPYGSLSKKTKSYFKKNEDMYCFDSINSTFNIDNYDYLQIPRISIWNLDIENSFKNKINGKWDFLNKFQKNNVR